MTQPQDPLFKIELDTAKNYVIKLRIGTFTF